MDNRSMKLNIPKIRKEMARQRITQSELARRLGCSRQYIDLILNVTPSRTFNMVERLSDVLGVLEISLVLDETTINSHIDTGKPFLIEN